MVRVDCQFKGRVLVFDYQVEIPSTVGLLVDRLKVTTKED